MQLIADPQRELQRNQPHMDSHMVFDLGEISFPNNYIQLNETDEYSPNNSFSSVVNNPP